MELSLLTFIDVVGTLYIAEIARGCAVAANGNALPPRTGVSETSTTDLQEGRKLATIPAKQYAGDC